MFVFIPNLSLSRPETSALWVFCTLIGTLTHHGGIVGIPLCVYNIPHLCCVCLVCFYLVSDCVFPSFFLSSWRSALRAQLPCDRTAFLRPPVGTGHRRDAVWTERDGHLRGWDVSGRTEWTSWGAQKERKM